MVVIPSNRPHPRSATPSRGKSALDRSVAALLLLLSGVCLIAIAVAIWLEDDGPVLARERRVGPGGREFNLLRFRTDQREAPDAEAPGSAGPTPGLDRASRLGRLLRRYHLDLLPVLVNVLKGDLSLVGPRPHKAPGPRAAPRLGVRPGLVPPWLARSAPRSAAEEARAVQDYLRNWSPLLDIRLLWRTVRESLPPAGR